MAANYFDKYDQQTGNYFDKYDEPVAPQPEKTGMIRAAADIPVQVGRGIAQGVKALSDVFGADNPVSRAASGVEGYLGELLSAQAKNDQTEIARIMKDAQDKGVGDQVTAAVKAFATAPVDMLSQALGTAVPVIAGGLAGSVARLGAMGVGAIGTGVGAAMGAGTVKGQIYDAVKQELLANKVPEAEAEKRAQEAQSYGGKNLDQILMGAGIGAAEAAFGAERILTGLIRKGAVKPSALPAMARIPTAAATEALPEAAQAAQEQIAQNIALQREGYDVPTMRGVAGQAALEGIAGMGLGAIAGAAQRTEAAKPAEAPPTEEKPLALEYKPESLVVFPDGSVGRQQDVDVYIQSLPEDQRIQARARLLGMGERPATPAKEGEPLTPDEISQLDQQLIAGAPRPKAEDVLAEVRGKIQTAPPTTPADISRIRDEHETAVINSLLEQDKKMQGVADMARANMERMSQLESMEAATADADRRVREGRLMARVQSLIDENIPFASTAIADINRKFEMIGESPLDAAERARVQKIMTMAQGFTDFVKLPSLPVREQDRFAENQAMEALIKERKPRGEVPSKPIRAEAAPPSEVVRETPVPAGVEEGRAVRPEAGVEPGIAEDRERAEPVAEAVAPEPVVTEAETAKPEVEAGLGATQPPTVEAPTAEPTTLTIQRGGSDTTLNLGKPVWQATDDDLVKAVQDSGTYLGKPGSKYDPYMAWREAHSEAIQKAKREGKTFPPEVLYDKPRLIRDDLSDSQADEATDMMVDVYRATKDYGKAVEAYRNFGKRRAPEMFVAEGKGRAAVSGEEPKKSLRATPAQQVSDFEQTLRTALNKFGLKDVGVKLIEGMREEGSYAQQLIRIAADSANPIRTLRHEAIHALRELGFFTPQQWQSLSKMAKDKWIDQYLKQRNVDGKPLKSGEESRYDAYMREYEGDMEKITEEAVADAFADFDATQPPAGLMQALLTRLRNLFQAIKSALTKVESPEQIFGKVERGELAGGEKAKESALDISQKNNVFRGQAPGAGVSVGKTQPKGTPVEKLFSNFADTPQDLVPSQAEMFRKRMFERADKTPKKYANDELKTDKYYVGSNRYIQVDAAEKGNTRVRLVDDKKIVASARLEKGMIDSIAVPKEFAGKGYGAELLKWMDKNGIANIYEVPDRSPGFVKIQKQVIAEKQRADADIRKSLRKEEPKPAPTTAGQQALDTINQLGMGVKPPEPNLFEKSKKKLERIGEAPTKESMKQWKTAMSDFFAKIDGQLFSADAPFENKIRQGRREDFKGVEEFMGTMLQVSQSQAVAADAVSTQAMLIGKMKYDENAQKWVAIKDPANEVEKAKILDNIAKKYGLTKEEAIRVAHTYLSAANYEGILKRNAKNAERIKALRDEGKTDEAAALKAAEVYVTPEQAAMVDPGLAIANQIPEVKQITELWNKQRENVKNVLVETGLWTPEYADAMMDNAAYVPFYREMEDETDASPEMMMRGLQVKAKEHKLKGSAAPVADVFENMAKWQQYALNRAIRNHKAVQMIKVAKEMKIGDAPMAKEVSDAKKGKNVVRVWEDGKQKFYEMADPLFMDAFKSLGAVSIPTIKYFTYVANKLREFIVLYPMFSVAQLPQDAVAAIFASGLQPKHAFKIPFYAVKEAIKTFRGTSNIHNELKNFGAVGVRDFNSATMRQDAEITAGLKIPRGGVEKVKFFLERIAMSADNAVRQAVYQAAMEQPGVTQAEALEKAFEIINFRRRGSSKMINLIGQTVPFFYAYLSAQRVAYKTLTGIGISPTERKAALETLAYTSAAVMALSFMYAMANGDDEDYEKVPSNVRDRSIVIPGTGGLRIPLRPDFFLFPKIIAEHTYHLMADNGFSDPAKFKKAMRDNFVNAATSPNVVPQVIKPAFEIGINYDFFQGKPIIGFFEQNKEASRQFNDSTSEFAKMMGGAGLSPQKVDHFIRGYFGTVGGLFLWTTNFMIEGEPGVPRPELSWHDVTATMPGVGAFKQKSTENALKVDFYELRDAVEKAKNTYDDIKLRSPEGLKAFVENEENFAKLALEKRVTKVADHLSKIRRAIQQVAAAPEGRYTAEEKQKRIKELREIEMRILKSVNLKEMREKAMM